MKQKSSAPPGFLKDKFTFTFTKSIHASKYGQQPILLVKIIILI